MRSLNSQAFREGSRRDILRRLRARVEADIARLRIGGEGIASVLDHLQQSCLRIDDYLAECDPTVGGKRRARSTRVD